MYHTLSRVKSGGRVVYCLSPAGRIACKDGSLCNAFPGSWTPLSTFYKLLEIERTAFAESIGMATRHLSAIKASELRHRYFHELGATKLACLWILEHLGKTKRT
jgi:hypothetical protein